MCYPALTGGAGWWSMEKRWLLLLPQILVCTTDPWRRDGCLLQDAADCVIFWPMWLPLWSQSLRMAMCVWVSLRVVVDSFLKISSLLFRVENSQKGFLPLLPKNNNLSVCCKRVCSQCDGKWQPHFEENLWLFLRKLMMQSPSLALNVRAPLPSRKSLSFSMVNAPFLSLILS